MKPATIQSSLLFAIMVLTSSCSGQILVGQWKLQQVKVFDVPHHRKMYTLDLTRPDKIKADLFKDFQQQAKEEGGEIDTAEVKTDINQTVASYLKSKMTLSANYEFRIVSNGLIVPTAVPGWHFGDTLQGKWIKKNDTLVLSIGDSDHGHRWKFKMLQATGDILRLRELFEPLEGKENELWFVRQ
jgi:hypothetical protein